MKICILTHALHTNYGGLLQAFALQTILKRIGHEVVTDKYGYRKFRKRIENIIRRVLERNILFNHPYNPIYKLFAIATRNRLERNRIIASNTNRFINNEISTTAFFENNPLSFKNTAKKYDALVVGSDQVWRPAYRYVPAYFLHFTKGIKIKRIAYSASFGVDNWDEFTPELTKICSEAAKWFDGISVREDSGVELCKKYLGVDARHLLDPTMLLTKKDYLRVIEPEEKQERTNIAMCYMLDCSPEKSSVIDHVTNKLSLEPLLVMPREKYSPSAKQDITNSIYPSVSAWIAGFRDAEFVVTDSFHGTVFAIIFNKPFVVYANSKRGLTRFTSLLKIFNLEDRLIFSPNELTENHFNKIDYTPINAIIEIKREESLKFLKDMLNQ